MGVFFLRGGAEPMVLVGNDCVHTTVLPKTISARTGWEAICSGSAAVLVK